MQERLIEAAVLPHAAETDPLWYKDAVIYQLHVKAFHDADHNGVGDFAGLVEKLDHVEGLGVTTVWLLPFYPSPLRDDGHDISDYRNVNPAYGTLDDFQRFVDGAHARGLKVITELVINHTSDRHPWSSVRASLRRAHRSATFTSGARPTGGTATPGSSSSTPRNRTGRGTTRQAPITGTASTPISRTSTSTTRR